MLDIKFIREHPDIIKKDLEKRGDNEKTDWISEILSKDEEYRKLLAEAQTLRAKRNSVSKDINKAKKEGKDVKPILEEAKAIPDKIKKIVAQAGNVKEIVVVTDDRAIQYAVRALGAETANVKVFLDKAKASGRGGKNVKQDRRGSNRDLKGGSHKDPKKYISKALYSPF